MTPVSSHIAAATSIPFPRDALATPTGDAKFRRNAMRRLHVGAASPPLAPRSDNAGSVEDVIAGLADLDANGLRLQWRNHLGGTPARKSTHRHHAARRALGFASRRIFFESESTSAWPRDRGARRDIDVGGQCVTPPNSEVNRGPPAKATALSRQATRSRPTPLGPTTCLQRGSLEPPGT